MEFLKYFITEDIYVLSSERKEINAVHIKNGSSSEEKLSVPELKSKPDVAKPSETDFEEAVNFNEPVKEEEIRSEKTAPTQSPGYSVAMLVVSLNAEEEKLLNGIIKAINIPDSEIQKISTLKEVNSNSVIAFGQYPDLKNFPLYQVISKGGKQLLVADNLTVIAAEVDKKKKLWEALQQMFAR